MLGACTLSLPWPPSVNHLYKVNPRTGQRFIRKSCKYFYDFCKYQRPPSRFGHNPVGVHVTFYPPDNRRYDMDNRLKALFDGLIAMGLIDDDEFITSATLRKSTPVKGGQVIVSAFLDEGGA